jgi:hypothetical protein
MLQPTSPAGGGASTLAPALADPVVLVLVAVVPAPPAPVVALLDPVLPEVDPVDPVLPVSVPPAPPAPLAASTFEPASGYVIPPSSPRGIENAAGQISELIGPLPPKAERSGIAPPCESSKRPGGRTTPTPG